MKSEYQRLQIIRQYEEIVVVHFSWTVEASITNVCYLHRKTDLAMKLVDPKIF
jgi:sorbitol-specific phosphotransferase system component IIA